MRRLLFIILGQLALCSSALPQPAVFDLKECLNYAINNSPGIEGYNQMAKMQEEKFKAGYSQNLPQIKASLGFQYYLALPTYLFPEAEGSILSSGTSSGQYPVELGAKTNLSAGIQIDQTFFDKNWLLKKKMIAMYSDAKTLQKQKTEDEIIFQTASAYNEVLSMENTRKSLEFTLGILNELKSIVDLQFRNDLILKTEVDRLDLKIKQLVFAKKKLEDGIEARTKALQILMGMPTENLIFLADSLNSTYMDVDVVDDGKPDELKLMENQLLLQDLRISQTSGDNFPKVKGFASFNYLAQGGISSNDIYPLHFLGVRIDIPVFSGLQKKHEINALKFEKEYQKINLATLEQKSDLQTSSELKNFENQKTDSQQLQEFSDLSRQIYETIKMQYENGVTPLSEVLNAEREWREADQKYSEGQRLLFSSFLNLLKSKGQLNSLLN